MVTHVQSHVFVQEKKERDKITEKLKREVKKEKEQLCDSLSAATLLILFFRMPNEHCINMQDATYFVPS